MMKRLMISMLFMALIYLGVVSHAEASPGEIKLSAAISAVTLYPDMAMIKKDATLSLKKGENIFRLSGKNIKNSLLSAEFTCSKLFFSVMPGSYKIFYKKLPDGPFNFIQGERIRI